MGWILAPLITKDDTAFLAKESQGMKFYAMLRYKQCSRHKRAWPCRSSCLTHQTLVENRNEKLLRTMRLRTLSYNRCSARVKSLKQWFESIISARSRLQVRIHGGKFWTSLFCWEFRGYVRWILDSNINYLDSNLSKAFFVFGSSRICFPLKVGHWAFDVSQQEYVVCSTAPRQPGMWILPKTICSDLLYSSAWLEKKGWRMFQNLAEQTWWCRDMPSSDCYHQDQLWQLFLYIVLAQDAWKWM